METDDQGGQEPDDDKLDNIRMSEITDSFPEKILSIRTEDSILQEAAQELKELSNINLQNKHDYKQSNDDINDENIRTDRIHQVELEKQVQTGEITPFEAVIKQSNSQNVKGTFDKTSHLLDLEKYLRQQAELANQRKQLKRNTKVQKVKGDAPIPNKKLKISNSSTKSCKKIEKTKFRSSKKLSIPEEGKSKDLGENNNYSTCSAENNKLCNVGESSKGNRDSKATLAYSEVSKDNTADNSITNTNSFESPNVANDSGSEYNPSEDQTDSEDEAGTLSKKMKTRTKSTTIRTKRIFDDGDEKIYKDRVKKSGYRKHESWHKIDNLFKVPQSIWKRLYKYQRVSVQWLWELHGRNLGGLLGDEMGLGKTVQVIAFLAGLDCSELLSDGGRFRGLGLTLIICPATLMEQWVKHFHEWWPILRIVVLHQSGTYSGDVEYLIHSLKTGGVLITSYSGMLIHKDLLVTTQWHYVILDEGHKIRNPQAKISKAVKEFSTPHRLLLTGSPMQNSLKELWSLFDFILPGKLGTLPAFLEHCACPITRGGYANATPLQEATALQVATMLRDAITPYMLRRTKNDVQHHVSLPKKNEQVLFCSLTDEQKKLYKRYLRSEDVSFIIHEKRNHTESGRYRARLLIALSALRKICNHPDLFLYTSEIDSDDGINVSEEALEKFGYWKRAGKMTVVRSLLKIWKKQGHRVLLFTQGRQMMHILESLVQSEGYTYLRMDGTTPMSQRQQTIRLFNDNSSYFVFLLTTRVGGLGVNLTGANRVIIYDPDWNPATDAQARERAWRIGQNKSVTIYRLITAGTIEEKIYHRQIFKLLLSNKVLEDPRQRRLFKTSDLVELFNFNEPIDGQASESDRLFHESRLTPVTKKFSSSKIEKMRKLAATLSKSISQNASITSAAIQVVVNSEKVCVPNKLGNTEDNSKSNLTDVDTSDTAFDDTHSCHNLTEFNNDSLVQNTEIESQQFHGNENIVSDKTQNYRGETDALFSLITDNSTTALQNSLLNTSSEVLTNESITNTNTESTISHDISNAGVSVVSDEGLENNVSLDDANKADTTNKSEKTVASSNNTSIIDKGCKTRHKHKRNMKSSRSKKQAISAIFEGEQISCLIGRRLEHSHKDSHIPTEDDQYVLKKLFAKATVSSAFQHETVLSNSAYNSDDKNPMQRLARETAQESMENIRKSRKWCWKPTWDAASTEDD